jgi:hypothetical protein
VSDVYSARILDTKDYEEASQALQSIGQELANFQLTRDWNVTLSQKKTQLEGLQYRIAGMDRRGDDLESKAEFLVGHAGGFMKDALKHFDPPQVSQIEKAEARHAQILAQHPCDWSWQVYRGDVIPDDEALQALLCESAESITQIVKGAEQFNEFLSQARLELISIVRNVDAAGHEIPGLEEKLAIFGVAVNR